MKKLLLIIISIFVGLNAFGQIGATGKHKTYKGIKNIDILFVFNLIDNNTSLKYSGAYSSINWYKLSDPTYSISNQLENFNIENETGYILDVDGKKTTIWVVDYKQYLATENYLKVKSQSSPMSYFYKINSLQVENSPHNQCNQLNLVLETDPVILTNDKNLTVNYKTKSWNESTVEWEDKEINTELRIIDNKMTVDSVPLCDTRFKIVNDSLSLDLGLGGDIIESDIYSAVAVECHITSSVSLRAEENEGDRPSVASVLSGSGPLDISFLSNANVPIAEFYRWEIYKDNSLLYVRNDQDQRFTFNDAGQYKVKLTVSNGYCSYTDSVQVDISDSEIQVPYAFSPNGDGINDEFRVAYRSLTSFNCWVYNRWGRKVFYWTDPQKGWDGKINGKDASEGAYIYLIEAIGTDKKEYKLKGTINLLR